MSNGLREALLAAGGVTLITMAMILVVANGMKAPLVAGMIVFFLLAGLGTLAGARRRRGRGFPVEAASGAPKVRHEPEPGASPRVGDRDSNPKP